MKRYEVRHGASRNLAGKFLVMLVRIDETGEHVTGSITGIRSAEAADAHAIEYARDYDAPITTPMLAGGVA